MSNDQLKRDIRGALTDLVAAAPAALDEPVHNVVTVDRTATGRPWLRVAAGVVALSLVGAAGALIARSREQPPVTDVPPVTGWLPPGDEFPLEDLGVPDSSQWLTTDQLSRELGVEGHPPLIIETSLTYSGGATAELQRCLWQGGSGGCRSEWNTTGLSIGMTSSVDNGVASYDLWTWDNVPAGTAYVSYVDGLETRWQRPVAGVALLPNVEGDDEVVVAYSANGTELGRVDRATLAAQPQLTGPSQLADISQEQAAELERLTDSSLRDCLLNRGAVLSRQNVATMPPTAHASVIWDECVGVAKQVVAEEITAMGVEFFDPRTERPSSPNPAYEGSIIINVEMPEE